MKTSNKTLSTISNSATTIVKMSINDNHGTKLQAKSKQNRIIIISIEEIVNNLHFKGYKIFIT